MSVEKGQMKSLVEKILKENCFIDDEPPILYKGYVLENFVTPEESYSLDFYSIISFTSHPFVFFALENDKIDRNELVYVHDFNIYKVMRSLGEMVTSVFPLERKTQRRITFQLLYLIKEKLLEFNDAGAEKIYQENDFLVSIKVATPSVLEEIEYIEEILESYQ